MINLRTLVPLWAKQNIKQRIRTAKHLIDGHYFKLAKEISTSDSFFVIKEIKQSLKTGNTSSAKKHNLKLAINTLNNIIIQPNQNFSFWHLVGYPSKKRGYQESRAISSNELKQVVGGGLCQLSGLIYYLALYTGVQIIERHNHSIDIYKEEERFTPLGSDATVVYGYKDLHFKNTLQHPIVLSLKILNDELIGCIKSSFPIQPLCITFSYTTLENVVEVTTTISNADIVLSTQKNNYKKVL